MGLSTLNELYDYPFSILFLVLEAVNQCAGSLTINAQAKHLRSAWIKSNLAKNFELTSEQAGFLYGLRLTGHLANLSILNVHDALTRRHDLTNREIIIGLAALK